MENVINSKSIDKHLIKKYNFKILSSTINSENENYESQEENGKTEEVDTKNIIEEKEVSKETKDDFIAELLEKSDKMSSELIKLQMQIEEGQREFESRIKETKEEALKEGERIGFEKAKKEYEQKVEELKAQYISSIEKVDTLYSECKNYMENLKSELSDVSLEIAKEVIAKEISSDSKIIAYNLAEKLIEDIKNATNIEIKVNPKDYDYLKDKFADKSNIKISKDDAISEGGVVIFSEMGNIDGDIKTRMDKAKQLLMVEK